MMSKRLLYLVLSLGAAAAAGACADDPMDPMVEESVGLVRPAVLSSQGAGDQTRALTIADLEWQATGRLAPNSPISLVASIRGKVARPLIVRAVLLDGDGDRRGPIDIFTRSELPTAGSLSSHPAIIQFRAPGYYRVLMIATDSGARHDADTRYAETFTKTLWMVIDEDGGRLTHGFDPNVIDTRRYPAFGSYGPFVPRAAFRALRNPGTVASGPGGPSAEFESSPWIDGWIEYYNPDTSSYQRLPGAKVDAKCLNWDLDEIASVQTVTNPAGAFGVTCPQGTEYVSGWVWLMDDYSSARGAGGAFSGAFFEEPVYSSVQLRVGNDYSARVFLELRARAQVAFSRFGYSRSRVPVNVDDANDTGAWYCPAVTLNCPRADEIFIDRYILGQSVYRLIHEYGHAYQYVALEPWRSYTGGAYGYDAVVDLSTAYVEGFADFFGNWIAGDTLRSSEDILERNELAGNGKDGVLIHNRFAAFLYDLVDGTGTPNGPNNETGSDDDAWEFSASWLADTIRRCRPGANTRLDGGDEMAYCLEQDMTARAVSQSYSNAWRNYGSITFDSPVTLPTNGKTATRAMWLKNYYGVN